MFQKIKSFRFTKTILIVKCITKTSLIVTSGITNTMNSKLLYAIWPHNLKCEYKLAWKSESLTLTFHGVNLVDDLPVHEEELGWVVVLVGWLHLLLLLDQAAGPPGKGPHSLLPHTTNHLQYTVYFTQPLACAKLKLFSLGNLFNIKGKNREKPWKTLTLKDYIFETG